MRWGLMPSWWSKPLKDMKVATFNARAETVATKPMFRSPFKRNRRLIPVSGYYEWQDTPNGKQPWYFTARDGSPALTIAGLRDEWQDKPSGETLKSCTVIITEPSLGARPSSPSGFGAAAFACFATSNEHGLSGRSSRSERRLVGEVGLEPTKA